MYRKKSAYEAAYAPAAAIKVPAAFDTRSMAREKARSAMRLKMPGRVPR